MDRSDPADNATVAAVGRLTEALETCERARGHLYSFHQLTGESDFKVGDAVVLPAASIIKDRATWERAYRDAAARFHPDKGGTAADWAKLQDAKTLLDGLHQGRK